MRKVRKACPGKRVRHRKYDDVRDSVRDYMRMRELREDGQLPWRMIGERMGWPRTTAYYYYVRLQKLYEPA